MNKQLNIIAGSPSMASTLFRSDKIFIKLSFLLVIMCCLFFSLFGLEAGEVLLFSEGWEQGTYNWTVVNGTETNKWRTGNATYWAGSRSMYISNDNGNHINYDTYKSSIVHFWRSITIPASATNIRLTFQYKVNGERIDNYVYDYLTYKILPISANVTASRRGDNCLTGSFVSFTNTNNWTTHTKDIPPSILAGQTRKLVFSWINDSTQGSQPPAAIDNISLTYKIATNPPLHLTSSLTGKNITLSWDPPSPSSEGYVYGYRVYRDGKDISGIRYTTTFYDNTTDYQKTYRYHVVAEYKNPERVSGASNAITVETHLYPPQNLTSSLSGKTVNLSWDAPQSASEVTLVGYGIYRDGEIIAQQITNRFYADKTTEYNKTYIYYVVAKYLNLESVSRASNTISIEIPPKSYAWGYLLAFFVIALVSWQVVKMVLNNSHFFNVYLNSFVCLFSFKCPYCFAKMSKWKIPYICQDCGEKYYLNFFGRRPITCKKPACTGELISTCPNPKCETQIVQAALDTTPYSFSIIGTSSSGKTIFTTVMLQELSTVTDPELKRGSSDKDTVANQSENYQTLYGTSQRVLHPTATGLKKPQIWTVKNLTKNHTYTFTIYDGAGEDHESNIRPTSKVCQYLKASKAIVYTLDATKLLRNDDDKAQEIVDSLADYIKHALGKRTNDTLEIPIAVVLTKFDTVLNDHLFASALVKQNVHCVRNGILNLSELKQIDNEIRHWLEDIGKVAFLRTFSAHFREYHFFGVSSLGSDPNIDGTLTGPPKPHRVLDPILWLFKKAHFID